MFGTYKITVSFQSHPLLLGMMDSVLNSPSDGGTTNPIYIIFRLCMCFLKRICIYILHGFIYIYILYIQC